LHKTKRTKKNLCVQRKDAIAEDRELNWRQLEFLWEEMLLWENRASLITPFTSPRPEEQSPRESNVLAVLLFVVSPLL